MPDECKEDNWGPFRATKLLIDWRLANECAHRQGKANGRYTEQGFKSFGNPSVRNLSPVQRAFMNLQPQSVLNEQHYGVCFSAALLQ